MKSTFYSVCCLFLALTLPPTTVRADAVDDYLHAEMTRQHIPGLVLGVIRDGKLIRKQAYGMADLELNLKTEPDMLFEIGSASKSLTSMTVMMLVEEGKFGLEDPIGKHLPDTPAAWKNITVRQLLNHTSGLPEYATIPEFTITEEIEGRKMLDALSKMPMDFVPGSAFSYTNTGFFLLGLLIEKETGKSYEDVIKERILTPLGMTHTVSCDPYALTPGRASRYMMLGPRLVNSPSTKPTAAFSAGLWLSNVEDMAKWDAALREHKFLKPASYEEMWTALRLPSGGRRPYGLGWFVGSMNGHRVIWHPGNSGGYSATLTRFPDDNLSVIVLVNLYPVNADGLARGVAQRYVPALKAAVLPEQTDPDPERGKRLHAALDKLVEGDLSPDVFAPEMIGPLSTPRGKMQRQGLTALKNITHFGYVGMEKTPNVTYTVYRAVTPEHTFTVRFALLPDGKLSDILPQMDPLPEPQAKPAAPKGEQRT